MREKNLQRRYPYILTLTLTGGGLLLAQKHDGNMEAQMVVGESCRRWHPPNYLMI